MTSKNLDAIRASYEASGALDWEAAGRCVGPGYVDRSWHRDHCRSAAELQEAQQDSSAFSSARYDIEQAFEATNGAVIVQGRHTCTLAGPWRGMEATGRTVSFPFCVIFRFNDDGLIVHEEQYYDMYSVLRELGY